ncbi:potassium/sodium eff [Apiospora kogelbergensis]|uniref:potassium/sodium eff n=1 Tax=Apiospora kogelbergensis TaxID=1337665 RepID=UPI0031306FDE
MIRPPHSLRVGVFTWEIIADKMAYGFFMGALCLASFTSVALFCGLRCRLQGARDYVRHAQLPVAGDSMGGEALHALAVRHEPRDLRQGPFAVFKTVYRNRFLFGAVMAGFVITFPVVYLPVINRLVFKHEAIGREWGVVVACVLVYLALIEVWKAGKRRLGVGVPAYATPHDVTANNEP